MQVQQGCGRTGTRGDALLGVGLLPGGIGAEAGSAADGGILALNLSVKHALCGDIAGDFFVGQNGHQTLLHGSKAALNLALGLRAGCDQVGDAQCREGALELRTGVAVIGHGIMAKEAEAVGVDDHRQAMPEKESAEMLEVIPSGVSGDEDCAQELAGMVVNGEQQGLLVIGGPPLVDGGIVLPQFIDA